MLSPSCVDSGNTEFRLIRVQAVLCLCLLTPLTPQRPSQLLPDLLSLSPSLHPPPSPPPHHHHPRSSYKRTLAHDFCFVTEPLLLGPNPAAAAASATSVNSTVPQPQQQPPPPPPPPPPPSPPQSSRRCRRCSRFRVMPSQHRAVSNFLCDGAARCAGVFAEPEQNCNPLLCRSARQQNQDGSLHFLRGEALAVQCPGQPSAPVLEEALDILQHPPPCTVCRQRWRCWRDGLSIGCHWRSGCNAG